jgi:predicted PhzF superfamily epimerase YddE/YHI9
VSLPIFVVDAFTDEAFRGNPAAVVLGHGDAAWMQ